MKSSYARALPFACNIAIRPGDVVFAVDRAGRFVYWNRNAQAVIGRSPATVAGLPLAAVFPEHEGGPDRARLDLSAVMAGRDYAGAFRASRADGSPVTLYVYATAGRAKQSPAGAEPAGVVFVARDVTNQVEVEQAARLKDELYRQVLRLAHDVVLVLDESGRVLEPNRALSLLTGIPEEELFGSPLAGMLAPGGREAAEGELSRLWEHGEAVFSLSFAGRAGQKVRVDFNASVLGGQARRLAVAVGRDASGPEQVRQQVKTAELKSRRVFEAVRDGVLLHMLAGQVLDVNEGACRLFGYLREELLGINVERLFPRDSLAGFLRLRDAILRSGEFYGEGAGRRRDGTELPVELSCSRLALGDETLVITLVRDITERRRAEQAVRESEELHRLTLNAMSDPAHVIDREHNILLANDALLRLAKMLGVESDPIGGKLFELFPFLEEQVRPATERVFETGRPVRLEEAYIIGGQRREAEVDELPVFEAGKVTRVLTVIRDITARKRQEEMLERLAGAATGFLELPPDADIYLYAADRLAELLPGITFAVSVYDEAAATLTVRRIAGLTEEEQAGFRRTLSEAHEGAMLARVGPAVRDALVAGVVREVAGGVYGAMLERVPEPVCREVERRLGIERVLSVGLHRENRLYGSVTFFLRGGRLLDRGLVEAFAGQWAIALERREVQQALAASEERYSSLFYNSPIGIYRTTPDGRMLMANPALVGMLGLDSFEELARMNVAEASYRFGYDREEFKRRIAVSGEITGLESVLTLADGTRRYIRENARAVRGPDGAVAYYDGTVEDLTERHQAEERARAERARAETYLEVAGVVILALDEQGLVSLVNRRGCELLDTTEDEALGSDWVERFVPAADREKTRATFAALMRGELELAEEFENRVLTATGEARLVHWHNVLLRDPEGKTIGTLSSGEDITERRAAEEALREREAMLQDLRDNVPVGLFRTTPDGRFLAVNPAGVRLAGYESEAEMLGTPVAALYADPGKRDELRALLAREGAVSNYEIVSRRPDGSTFSALFDVRVVPGPDGRPRYFDGTLRDISAQKAAEQALRERQALLETLAKMSLELLHAGLEQADSVVEAELGKMAFRARADRGYVFLFSEDGRTMNNTHEWCAAGIELQKKALQGLPVEGFPWWVAKLTRGEHIHVPRVADLPPEAAAEKEILEAQDIVSVLVLPVAERGRLRGYIGLDWVRGPMEMSEDLLPLLQVSADLLFGTLNRARAEAAQRASEEHLQALLETSPDGIAVHQEGRVILMNPAGVRMLGYDDPAEVIGMSVLDFLHPDEREEVLARMRRIVETGPTGVPAEARFRRRDGSYIPLEVANARLDWQGRPAIQVVFRDITARREARQALEASEERYRNVVERALDGICIIREGRIVYLNPQLAALAGRTVEECLNRPFVDFLPPQERVKVAERYRRRMAGEEVPESYETTLLGRGDREVRVELKAGVVMHEGMPADLVFVRDITARRRAEVARAETEERYRALFNAAPWPVMLVRGGLVALANPAAARLLGCDDPAQLVGASPLDMVVPEGREVVAAHLAELARGGENPEVEITLLARDGSRPRVIATSRPVTVDGEPAALVIGYALPADGPR